MHHNNRFSYRILNYAEPGGSIRNMDQLFRRVRKVKKLKDEKVYGADNEITDRFLAMAGCETLKKISTRETKELTFNEIVKGTEKNKRQKKKKKKKKKKD